MIAKLIIAVLLILGLAGCSHYPAHYGQGWCGHHGHGHSYCSWYDRAPY